MWVDAPVSLLMSRNFLDFSMLVLICSVRSPPQELPLLEHRMKLEATATALEIASAEARGVTLTSEEAREAGKKRLEESVQTQRLEAYRKITNPDRPPLEYTFMCPSLVPHRETVKVCAPVCV